MCEEKLNEVVKVLEDLVDEDGNIYLPSEEGMEALVRTLLDICYEHDSSRVVSEDASRREDISNPA